MLKTNKVVKCQSVWNKYLNDYIDICSLTANLLKAFDDAILQNICSWGILENRMCSYKVFRKLSWKFWCDLEIYLEKSLLEKKNTYFSKIARQLLLTLQFANLRLRYVYDFPGDHTPRTDSKKSHRLLLNFFYSFQIVEKIIVR